MLDYTKLAGHLANLLKEDDNLALIAGPHGGGRTTVDGDFNLTKVCKELVKFYDKERTVGGKLRVERVDTNT